MVNLSGGRWWRWPCLIVAIALLLVSITGCNQLPLASDQSPTVKRSYVSGFVPRHAPLSFIVDTQTNPNKTWSSSKLSQFLSSTIDSWLATLELDLDRDIRPWLGKDIAFAVTDQDLAQAHYSGRQGGYLLVADIADSERLREFLEIFWQRQIIAGTQPNFTKASGVPIITGLVAQEQQTLVTAVVGMRTLLIANDIKVLQQSLRVAQTPTLQLSEYSCCQPVWLNLRIPDLIEWLGLGTSNDLGIMSVPQWQQLVATADFLPSQLVINTYFKGLGRYPDVHTAESKPELINALPTQYLPASLAWAAIGHDLSILWTGILNELSHYERLPSPINQGKQWFSTRLAQTLIEPLTQLLANDYAIGQLADGSWLMATNTDYPKLAGQLDKMAAQEGLTVSQFTLEEQSVTVWSRLKTRVNNTQRRETTVETDLVALHTKVQDCNLFATSIDGLMAALAAPNRKLSDTQKFQHTVQFMDTPNQGYLYGTWDEIERLLASNRWFSLVKPIFQPWSQSIDTIAITRYGQTNNQSTGQISILLKD